MAADDTPESTYLPQEHPDAEDRATHSIDPTLEEHQEDQEAGRRAWRCGDPYRYQMPQNMGEPWQACHNLVSKYDKHMCESWRDEVDNLLIFAGLFSAVVTAFAVESYKWLQEDTADLSVKLLAQISLQLQNIQLSNSSVMASPTIPTTTSLSNGSEITSSAIRINILWFLSLTLSLSTVLLGILCMQWLREYMRDTGLPHKDAVALRQMRFEGLMDWKVPQILSTLPLLLQLALILFFAGLLDLLWSLHRVVASLVTVVVGLVLLSLVFTTVLPTIQYMYAGNQRPRISQCAYKSPQSWAFHRLVQFIARNVGRHERMRKLFPRLVRYIYFGAQDQNWADYDLRWKKLRDISPVSEAFLEREEGNDIVAGLSWINQSYRKTVDAVYVLHQCLQDLPVASAAKFVAESYPEALPRLREALNHTMRFSSTVEKKEFISALYLEKHRKIHRTLTPYHLERIIRLINVADIVPFAQWPLTSPAADLPEEIALQFLMSLKLLLSRDRIPPENIFSIWMLIKDLVLHEASSEEAVAIALSVIAEFDKWLLRPSTDIRRVKLCGSSIIMVFVNAGEPSPTWKRLVRTGGWQVRSLFRTLDARMMEMGGTEEVLGRTASKRWDNLMSNALPREDAV